MKKFCCALIIGAIVGGVGSFCKKRRDEEDTKRLDKIESDMNSFLESINEDMIQQARAKFNETVRCNEPE